MKRQWTEKRVVFEGTLAEGRYAAFGLSSGEKDHRGKTLAEGFDNLMQQEHFELGDRVRVTVERLRDPEPEGDSE